MPPPPRARPTAGGLIVKTERMGPPPSVQGARNPSIGSNGNENENRNGNGSAVSTNHHQGRREKRSLDTTTTTTTTRTSARLMSRDDNNSSTQNKRHRVAAGAGVKLEPGVKEEEPEENDNNDSGNGKGTHNNDNIIVIDDDDDDDESSNDNNNNNTQETHIIFVVDFSSSMLIKDIKTKMKEDDIPTEEDGGGGGGGKKKNKKKKMLQQKQQQHQQEKFKTISRWDAVFESLEELVNQQVEQNTASADGSTVSSGVIISLVIFNDEARTLLDKMPLVGDGAKVRKKLETARKAYRCKGGTGFAAGLQRAKQLAASTDSNDDGNVMVVFLSDGRPGDLKPRPPKDVDTPMQLTFRRKGATYDAAGVHIEEMKARYKDRFNLQLICLFSDGKPWLEYLGKRYGGTFHMCGLTLDDDEDEDDDNTTPTAPVAAVAPAAAVAAAAAARKHHEESDDDDDEDEILEMKVKSQDTLIAERYARARATGNVFSIAATTQNNSSIRSTFQSISSTVTAMRNGATGRRRLQERQIVLENGNRSEMVQFRATRMVLKPTGDGVKNAPGERSDGRVVSIATQPFAQGGLRNVFRMTEGGSIVTTKMVGKESRHEVPYAQRLRFHLEGSRCQAQTAKYATRFNAKLKSIGLQVGPIEVLHAEVYRVKDPTYPGGYRYLGVEEELMGTYEKYNSNNGFVLDSDSPQNLVAQAFSHFSYEHSNREEMVVDIQGSGYAYTDPQLHSKKKEYGRADRGDSGFKDFFKTHKCNHICKALELQEREEDECLMAPLRTVS